MAWIPVFYNCAMVAAQALPQSFQAGFVPGGGEPQSKYLAQLAFDTFARLQRLYFAKVVSDAYAAWDGCMDAASMLHVLKPSFERNARRGALVDIGANVGHVLKPMVRIFAEPVMVASIGEVDPDTGDLCKDLNGKPILYAFEPNPGCLAELDRIAARLKQATIAVIPFAVSDTHGEMTFYHSGAGDQGGSLSRDVSSSRGFRNAKVDVVKVVTLDEFFKYSVFIHLLKIDVEGFDPLVLRGAQKLLSKKRVKFIVFEIDRAWRAARHFINLKTVTDELLEKGYICFLMTKSALVPISGQWWQETYEWFTWANVFCGQEGDSDLFAAYVAFGTNNYTLSYALSNLLTSY